MDAPTPKFPRCQQSGTPIHSANPAPIADPTCRFLPSEAPSCVCCRYGFRRSNTPPFEPELLSVCLSVHPRPVGLASPFEVFPTDEGEDVAMALPVSVLRTWDRRRPYGGTRHAGGTRRRDKCRRWDVVRVERTDGESERGIDEGNEPRAVRLIVAEDPTVLREFWSRGRWLLGLLVLQSSSSFVLDKYTRLIQEHIVVTLFLTMLVGAGGNAGNQSAIKVIRGMATGKIKANKESLVNALYQQAQVALLLGAFLGGGGFVRVFLTTRNMTDSLAISLSLFSIVITSVLAGTSLPFALAKAGVDPANAGTTIQVIMDVTGVLITCIICSLILDQASTILQ